VHEHITKRMSNLAKQRFLMCVIFKIWTEDNPPTQQPLEWCAAVVIYGVVFSAMHRLELGLKAFAEMTACTP